LTIQGGALDGTEYVFEHDQSLPQSSSRPRKNEAERRATGTAIVFPKSHSARSLRAAVGLIKISFSINEFRIPLPLFGVGGGRTSTRPERRGEYGAEMSASKYQITAKAGGASAGPASFWRSWCTITAPAVLPLIADGQLILRAQRCWALDPSAAPQPEVPHLSSDRLCRNVHLNLSATLPAHRVIRALHGQTNLQAINRGFPIGICMPTSGVKQFAGRP